MTPPAPARLSTITCLPRRSPKAVATTRPVTSLPPPGGKGMIIRIGLVGKSCADAAAVSAMTNAAVASGSVASLGILFSIFRLGSGGDARSSLAPDRARSVDDQSQLGELLVGGHDRVADIAGKSALRAEAEAVLGYISRRLLEALAQHLRLFKLGRFGRHQPEHDALVL